MLAAGKLLVRDGREWCADIFDKFVTADQSVGVGETLLRRYTPARADQNTIVLHLYCTHKEKVTVSGSPGDAMVNETLKPGPHRTRQRCSGTACDRSSVSRSVPSRQNHLQWRLGAFCPAIGRSQTWPKQR